MKVDWYTSPIFQTVVFELHYEPDGEHYFYRMVNKDTDKIIYESNYHDLEIAFMLFCESMLEDSYGIVAVSKFLNPALIKP